MRPEEPAALPGAALAYEGGWEVGGRRLFQEATISADSDGEIRGGFLEEEVLELSRHQPGQGLEMGLPLSLSRFSFQECAAATTSWSSVCGGEGQQTAEGRVGPVFCTPEAPRPERALGAFGVQKLPGSGRAWSTVKLLKTLAKEAGRERCQVR